MAQIKMNFVEPREILKTAELMFRQKGFDNTEIRDITGTLK